MESIARSKRTKTTVVRLREGLGCGDLTHRGMITVGIWGDKCFLAWMRHHLTKHVEKSDTTNSPRAIIVVWNKLLSLHVIWPAIRHKSSRY